MSSIAFKTLAYEWRRFLPAVVAIGFSGLLVLIQAAIILGVFSLSSVYVTKSSADLWVGYPGVQSIDLGQPIAGATEYLVRSNPGVERVEPFIWGSGQWRTAGQGVVNVYIVGLDLQADAMGLADAITPEMRARLAAPGAILIDQADLDKLAAGPGSSAEINGQTVHIVGVTSGLRGLGGVNVLTSVATARRLDPQSSPGDQVAYFLGRVTDGQDAQAVADQLNLLGQRRGYEALTASGFADRTTQYWVSESGAGVAFVFGSVIAILVAVIVASQTLSAAVAASIKEYAALRALGFSMGALRSIVMGQTWWIAAFGMGLAAPLLVALVVLADAQDVPIVVSPFVIAAAIATILIVAAISGALALRRVGAADPAMLLQ